MEEVTGQSKSKFKGVIIIIAILIILSVIGFFIFGSGNISDLFSSNSNNAVSDELKTQVCLQVSNSFAECSQAVIDGYIDSEEDCLKQNKQEIKSSFNLSEKQYSEIESSC